MSADPHGATTARQWLSSVLLSDGPDPAVEASLHLYGRFVGRWSMAVQAFDRSGAVHHCSGEIAFGWALNGRAIQDVWMIPTLAERGRGAPAPVTGNWYGTTLRVFDPAIDAWHIFWIDPATGFHCRQLGRAVGDDIVQEGALADGTRTRWTFSDIQADAFRWSADVSMDGSAWRRSLDIRAVRQPLNA